MQSQVYFASMKCRITDTPLNKIKKLMNKCDADKIYEKNELVAVKVHFGEYGNTAFIRPVFLRPVIENLRRFGTKPFLTDTNTLYVGMRTNSVDHMHNANFNGFGYSTLQVPVIIADGLRGELYESISVPNGIHYKEAKIAPVISGADKLFVMSHFKGHEMTGFGGALKNLAMGCASRTGKMEMHSSVRPTVNSHKCTACGRCKVNCQVDAISISKTAFIGEKCVGCAMCISVCPENAIDTDYNVATADLQQRIAEYAAAVHHHYSKPPVYINVLTSIVPACDCRGGNDAPMIEDLGFMASTDPVALDKASYDMVVKAAGRDIFQEKWTEIDPTSIFEHAEKIGFGNLDYKLNVIS